MTSDDHAISKNCLICFDDITKCRTVTPCDHNETCAVCHLRLRFLNKNKGCPICKAENDRVIVDSDVDENGHHRKYGEYEQWGDDIGQNYCFRSDVGMFFHKAYFENTVKAIFCLDCGVKNCKDHLFKNNQQLKKLHNHLRTKHGMTLCHLCVDNKRDFVSALPRFTPSQLKKHESSGDGAESGFKGHPMCKFCKPKRFYDLMQLHDHLNKEHYKCHLCEKQGKNNQYYKDYTSLNRHFDKVHFLCHDPQCLMARFVVFGTELDLRMHEIEVHGSTTREDSRIKVEFQVRRSGYDGSGLENQTLPSDDDFQYGLDGEVFVPDALPNQEQHIQENEPTITDANHAARTAQIRRDAAEIRAREAESQAFPTLQSAEVSQNNGSNNAVSTGASWVGSRSGKNVVSSGRRPGNMRAEDFPTLNGGTGSRARSSNTNWKNASARKQSSSSNKVGWSSSAPPVAISAAPVYATRPAPSIARSAPAAPTSRPISSSIGGGGWGNSGATRAKSSKAPAMTKEDFPSLGGSTSSYAAAQALSKKHRNQQMKGKKAPSSAAMSNVLAAPAPLLPAKLSEEECRAKLDAMKLHLGKDNYKKVKEITKRFVNDAIDPETYVLNMSDIFGGINDPDFLEYIPTLIRSCPNQIQANKALAYLNRKRQMR